MILKIQEDKSEEEPKLKYERLSNGVTEILQKDVASCVTVHEKVLCDFVAEMELLLGFYIFNCAYSASVYFCIEVLQNEVQCKPTLI